MPEPIWMDKKDALVAHDLELASHGGSAGVRDLGLPESAMARALPR
jgi:death on curing protein